MELIHGGDVTGYELAFGRAPLDFSASLNPFGLPEGVARAARDAVGRSVPYPDPLCRRLRAALGERLGVGPESLFCGNGAADVIYRLVLAAKPSKALLTAPTFAEYERALRCAGSEIVHHLLRRENAFALDRDILAALTPDVDMAFVCQPNNPTGQLVDADLLEEILHHCEERQILLVLDECFVPFVDDAEGVTFLPKAAAHPGLFILGSFTKLYAMAGLRLGFGISADRALVEAMDLAGQPWSVSTIAQEAGLAALNETAYVRDSLAALREERAWLSEQLKTLGLESAGRANYLFFRSDAPNLHKSLAESGLLIRDCGNFRGLERGDYRVAVRLRDENRRLIEALRRSLGVE